MKGACGKIMSRFMMSDIEDNASIHFIGIGGISMSGLAQIVLKQGYRVTGSDWNESHKIGRAHV